MPPSLVTARHQWEDGQRRLEEARADRKQYARLHHDVGLVLDDLRRRVGVSFTLADLAAAYDRAEDWTRDLLEERGAPGWPSRLTVVLDAAFHAYARGAVDYTP